jgi:putative nucleotidyltransferase with HDIG domain
MPAAYRIRQFLWAARASVEPEREADEALIRALPPGAVGLFRKMPRYDRRHALQVARTLQAQGQTDPDLMAAALLHDVGKTTPAAGRLRLWHRVAVVLLLSLAPGLLERIGQDRPERWRRPFYVQQHHAALGAELARQAGCSPRTVAWIAGHEQAVPTGDPALDALRAADNQN